MTLSMKPDLQKPTSPSSFSGLIGATTGSMVTKPKVTAEVDAGIRSENQNFGFVKIPIPDSKTYH